LVDTETVTVTGDGTYTTPTGFTLPSSGTSTGTYQWDATYYGDANNIATSDVNSPTEQVTVSAASPTLSTTAIPDTVTLGPTPVTLTDSATLADGFNPTGTITFTLFHGSTQVDTETVAVTGDGTYTTPTGFTLPSSGSSTGTYQWDAAYSGDANNIATSDVNSPTEQVTVSAVTINTSPSPDTVTLGTVPVTLTDTATLADGLNPTGTITFTLFHGSTLVDTETVTVTGDGTYTTPTGFTLPSSGTSTGTYQWDAAYSGDANNIATSDVNNPNEQVSVSAASPTLSTTAIPHAVLDSTSVTLKDTADLEGAFHPAGTITFTLFHIGDSTPVDTETVAVTGNGTYTTPTGFTPGIASGTYQWDATYSGDANNTAASDVNNPNEQVTVGHAPGAFDFNFNNDGDGHADVLLQSNSGAVSIWDNGIPSTASTIATSMPSTWHLAGIADFDGNGKTDILWTSDSGSVAIWDNSVIGHTIATNMPSSWHVVGTGDFDGNGKSDILWQNDSGAVAIWDNGQIGHTVAGPGSMLPANERVVGTGDFDGNGKTDILWQNSANGALTIWNNGQPAGATTIATSMPSSWHVAGVGDFDGNGKSDILWQNDNGSVAIWDNGQIGHTIATGMPSSWHVAGVGDFDHNGKSDILWTNDNGAVAIWDNAQVGHTIAGPGAVVPDWHIIA
jgi:hypothetical protein